MEKAVAYYRSGFESPESIELQKREISAFLNDLGIELIHDEADDGFSGSSLERPGFKKILNEWIMDDKKDFAFVVMTDPARLGRFEDSSEFEYWEAGVEKCGRRFIFLNDHGLPTVKTT